MGAGLKQLPGGTWTCVQQPPCWAWMWLGEGRLPHSLLYLEEVGLKGPWGR